VGQIGCYIIPIPIEEFGRKKDVCCISCANRDHYLHDSSLPLALASLQPHGISLSLNELDTMLFRPLTLQKSSHAPAWILNRLYQIPPEKRSVQLLELINTLFNTEHPGPYIWWLNSYNQDYDPQNHSFYRVGLNVPQLSPPIYFAELLGELSTCEWLVKNGYRIDDPSGNCTLGDPLQAAAFGNHTEIVQLLLDEGAQVNTDCGYFGDPLQAAAFSGGLETVELLLQNGAIINTEHGEYGNALIAAAHMGHLEVAKKLVECGADLELSSRNNGKAIAGAAASGQAELVRLLLLKGNNINDPNEPTGSALYCASKASDVQLYECS
jgi:hypothetical protein